MTKKKRWKPEVGDIFWYHTIAGEVYSMELYRYQKIDEGNTNWLGLYRTKKEALAMRKAIKNFVTKKIGGV